jgi:TPR repeat protein
MAAGKRSAAILILALCLAAPARAQTAEEGYAAYDAGDYAKAKTILLPLAEAGDPKAMNRIGYMYRKGKGFPKNPTLGCDWYEKAAKAGFHQAQSNLSICFHYGEGRPKDIDKAIFWSTQAAEQGNIDSQVALVRLLHDRDPQKAREWGQKAANAGSVAARLMMEDYGLTYSGPRPSRYQKYCFILMVGLLKKPWDYCDYPVTASEPPRP